jgi:hypothetical protein
VLAEFHEVPSLDAVKSAEMRSTIRDGKPLMASIPHLNTVNASRKAEYADVLHVYLFVYRYMTMVSLPQVEWYAI